MGLEGTWSDTQAYIEPLGRKLLTGDLRISTDGWGEEADEKGLATYIDLIHFLH